MKTLQQTIDFIAESLIAQGSRAINSATGDCVYRGCGDSKCAIGFLIPDEEYNPLMEGLNIIDLLRGDLDVFGEFTQLVRANRILFDHIQSIHDSESKDLRLKYLKRAKDDYPLLDFRAFEPWVELGT